MSSATSDLLELLPTNLPGGVLKVVGKGLDRAIPDRDYSAGIRAGVHPSQVAGLVTLHEADKFTDLQPGGFVSSWPDASGNGYTLTPANPGPRWYPNGCGGRPGVLFTRDQAVKMQNTSVPVNYGAFTVVIVYQPEDRGLDYNWPVGFGTGNGGIWDGGGSYQFQDSLGAYYSSIGTNPLSSRSPGATVLILTSNGTDIRWTCNGEPQLLTNCPLTGGIVYGLTMASTFGGGAPTSGFFSLLATFNRACTPAETDAMTRNLMAKYAPTWNFPALDKPLIVVAGNSIARGAKVARRADEWGERLYDALGRETVEYRNFATSGMSWGQMLYEGPIAVDPLYDARRSRNILIALEGVNDHSTNSAATYVAARVAAGWEVWLVVPPGSRFSLEPDSTWAPYLARVATYRASYLDWGATGLIDIAADPKLGPSGPAGSVAKPYDLYPEMWASDLGHPSNLGHGRLAQHVIAAIAPTLRPETTPASAPITMTSDATGQTAVVRRVPLKPSAAYHLILEGTVRRTDGGAESAEFRRACRISCPASGNPTITAAGSAANYIDYSPSGMTTADVSVAVSALNPGMPAIDVRFIGEAGKTLSARVGIRLIAID